MVSQCRDAQPYSPSLEGCCLYGRGTSPVWAPGLAPAALWLAAAVAYVIQGGGQGPEAGAGALLRCLGMPDMRFGCGVRLWALLLPLHAVQQLHKVAKRTRPEDRWLSTHSAAARAPATNSTGTSPTHGAYYFFSSANSRLLSCCIKKCAKNININYCTIYTHWL